jgi:hypothetical protein
MAWDYDDWHWDKLLLAIDIAIRHAEQVLTSNADNANELWFALAITRDQLEELRVIRKRAHNVRMIGQAVWVAVPIYVLAILGLNRHFPHGGILEFLALVTAAVVINAGTILCLRLVLMIWARHQDRRSAT